MFHEVLSTTDECAGGIRIVHRRVKVEADIVDEDPDLPWPGIKDRPYGMDTKHRPRTHALWATHHKLKSTLFMRPV